MSTLVSPGTSISVIDESFYASAGPGTVPLIFIATRENKLGPSGEAIAEGTRKENAGNLYLITSQRELIQTFGTPEFYSVAGTARHGYELNEYGLLAVHSFLGISNRALVMRADVDLGQLEPSNEPPVAPVQDDTVWVDLNDTQIGLAKWNAATEMWEQKTVRLVDDYTQLDTNFVPLPSLAGPVGSYVMVAGNPAAEAITPERMENKIYRRGPTSWEALDSATIPEKIIYRSHTRIPQLDEVLSVELTDGGEDYVVGDVIFLVGDDTNGFGARVRVTEVDGDGEILAYEFISGGSEYTDVDLVQDTAASAGVAGTGATFTGSLLSANDYWVKTTTPANGTRFSVKTFDGNVGQFIETNAPLAQTRDSALLLYGSTPQPGDIFVHYDYDNESNALTNSVAQFSLMRHNGQPSLNVTANVEGPSVTTGDILNINGVDVEFTGTDVGQTVADITNAEIPNIIAEVGTRQRLVLRNTTGRDIILVNVDGDPIADLGLEGDPLLDIVSGTVHSNWQLIDYVASFEQPSAEPVAGTLWYSTSLQVDILENNGLGNWVEFQGEVYLQPSRPFGASAGDIWVDTDQVDEYPVVSRFTGSEWIQIDNADQTSPDGILFNEARPTLDFGSNNGENNGDTIGAPDLDADAPDALVYPKGMLLWNTRYSTYNVKEWVPEYTFNGVVIGDRWVTRSGNDFDGSPYMGRRAVKQVIVQAIASQVVSNDLIRAENIFYNLVAAPGFPELIDEMVSLNIDKKQTAFIIGDSPMRLRPEGTALQNWATNANGGVTNSDLGLLTADPYLGIYYPAGLSTNLDGQEVVAPASHMALRTFAFNDQVAYQWFAPAGYQRGTVTNAVNVGFVNDEDEFVPVELNEGQRDVLYLNNINPISFRPNRGLVIFGQKTRSPVSSALDRVNVARLINYIRYQLPRLLEPYLFEPNDNITRRSVQSSVERFMEELVILRGVFEFVVQVDESNNTPGRIDRNELWVDIAVAPAKAIEFIYVPIRIRNTGQV